MKTKTLTGRTDLALGSALRSLADSTMISGFARDLSWEVCGRNARGVDRVKVKVGPGLEDLGPGALVANGRWALAVLPPFERDLTPAANLLEVAFEAASGRSLGGWEPVEVPARWVRPAFAGCTFGEMTWGDLFAPLDRVVVLVPVPGRGEPVVRPVNSFEELAGLLERVMAGAEPELVPVDREGFEAY